MRDKNNAHNSSTAARSQWARQTIEGKETMTAHNTKTGRITLVDCYGHGKWPKNHAANAPAHLTIEYDGRTTVWRFTGSLRDAAEIAAQLDCPENGERIGVLRGNHVSFDATPDDFWLDEQTGGAATDETLQMTPNTAKYSDAVAW